jgi:ATP-dependent helicase/nuclease subunit B
MSPTITLLVGPARCGKTHQLLDRYRQVLQADRHSIGAALWLAPNGRAAADVREELIRGGLRAALDPGVATFESLARRVLARLPAVPRGLTPLQRRVIVRRLIDQALAERQLVSLADSAAGSSFVERVDEHIQGLKRHGISPAVFARVAEGRVAGRQHAELAALYTGYERLLAAHRLVDQEGRPWALCDALVKDAALLGGLKTVVVDGFSDFSRAQLEILAALAGRAERLSIALPGAPASIPAEALESENPVERTDLFAKAHATLAELRRIFPTALVERLAGRASDWPALDHICEHLIQHPRDVPEPSAETIASLERIEIVAAGGVHDEFVELARHVKRQLIDDRRDGGRARAGEVVVVFRNLRSAAARLREVFDEFGIPYSLETGVPLAAIGLLRTLLDLLRLDLDDWTYRRLTAVVTNNLLSAFDRPARAAAEWLVRELQIAQGRGKLLARAESLASELASVNAESSTTQPPTHRSQQSQAAATALPLLTTLAAALDALPQAATPTLWLTALQQLAGRLGLNLAAPSQTAATWQEISRHFAAREQLSAWLDEGPPELSRQEILDLLVELAQRESLPRRFDDSGRVRVLSAATARTLSADHVYLAGMSEQSFPAAERSGPFYSEADYRKIARVAHQTRGKLPATHATRSQEEMLLFYEVLSRARKRLTISYPALDEQAQVLAPSPYVTEIERTVRGATISHPRAAHPALLPPAAAPLSPADWRVLAIHEALDAPGSLDLLAGLFRDDAFKPQAASLEAAVRMAAARSRRDAFGPAEGLLESDAVRAALARRFGSDHLWSPSQWETFALCPFKFYMSGVLAREPLRELVVENDPRHRGTLVHRTLAEFHRRLPELLGRATRLSAHEAEKFASQFGAVLADLVRTAPEAGLEAALVELDRRQVAKWGTRYHAELQKYDSAWPRLDAPPAPEYLEWRFGPSRYDESEHEDRRSTSEPFVLDLGNEKIRITGRIDRIDVGEAGGHSLFNVIDYKSGRRPTLTEEKIASGERLQPALYVMAAQALLFEGDRATPLWAGYWSMANGVTVDARYSLRCSEDGRSPSDNWDELQKKVVAQIGRMVRDIRSGNFPVASRDEHCTSYCEFATVCRVGQVRGLGKQWFGEETEEAAPAGDR